MGRAIGTDGCTTTHGGVVKATQFTGTHHGKPMLKTGDGFQCPKCKSWSTIMQGSGLLSWHGAKVALEGDRFTCGAELVAQQTTATVAIGGKSSLNNNNIIEKIGSQNSTTGKQPYNVKLRFTNENTGEPLTDFPHIIVLPNGEEKEFITDENGEIDWVDIGFDPAHISVKMMDLSKPLPPWE